MTPALDSRLAVAVLVGLVAGMVVGDLMAGHSFSAPNRATRHIADPARLTLPTGPFVRKPSTLDRPSDAPRDDAPGLEITPAARSRPQAPVQLVFN